MKSSRFGPGVLIAALIVSACGGTDVAAASGQIASDPTSQPSVSAATEATTSIESVAVEEAEATTTTTSVGLFRLTRAESENAGAFWGSSMGLAAITEVQRYQNLGDMAMSADAVIIGRLSGEFVVGPTISDAEEPAGAAITQEAAEVQVLELIRGALPVGGETILLSTFGTPDRFSSEPALMFLRWRGTGYEQGWAPASSDEMEAWDRSGYRLVSSQGLFLDTPRGPWNPITLATPGYALGAQPAFVDPVGVDAATMSFEDLLSLISSYP